MSTERPDPSAMTPQEALAEIERIVSMLEKMTDAADGPDGQTPSEGVKKLAIQLRAELKKFTDT